MTPSSPAKKAATSYIDYENGLGAMLNSIENSPSKPQATSVKASSSPDMQNNPAFNLKDGTLKAPGNSGVFSRSASPANNDKQSTRNVAVVTPSTFSFSPAGVGR